MTKELRINATAQQAKELIDWYDESTTTYPHLVMQLLQNLVWMDLSQEEEEEEEEKRN